MNRFAELLDRLSYEPGRNNKLRLITAYFRDTPDPDRGYALAAMTGALMFKEAKPGLIRGLVEERRSRALKEKGDTDGADRARKAAMESFGQAMDIQEDVIGRALKEKEKQNERR